MRDCVTWHRRGCNLRLVVFISAAKSMKERPSFLQSSDVELAVVFLLIFCVLEKKGGGGHEKLSPLILAVTNDFTNLLCKSRSVLKVVRRNPVAINSLLTANK